MAERSKSEGLLSLTCWDCWFESRRARAVYLAAVFCAVKVLGDGPITRLEESYRQWCVIMCNLETSRLRRPWPALGWCAREKNNLCLRKTSLRISRIDQSSCDTHFIAISVVRLVALFIRRLCPLICSSN